MDQLQLNFFDRQRKLPEVQDIGQKKLLDSHALIIGAGGLGSAVIENLARSGVGHSLWLILIKLKPATFIDKYFMGKQIVGTLRWIRPMKR
jgi:molybdopterin/thiamine biosynthesis adenylyltransferase